MGVSEGRCWKRLQTGLVSQGQGGLALTMGQAWLGMRMSEGVMDELRREGIVVVSRNVMVDCFASRRPAHGLRSNVTLLAANRGLNLDALQ